MAGPPHELVGSPRGGWGSRRVRAVKTVGDRMPRGVPGSGEPMYLDAVVEGRRGYSWRVDKSSNGGAGERV